MPASWVSILQQPDLLFAHATSFRRLLRSATKSTEDQSKLGVIFLLRVAEFCTALMRGKSVNLRFMRWPFWSMKSTPLSRGTVRGVGFSTHIGGLPAPGGGPDQPMTAETTD